MDDLNRRNNVLFWLARNMKEDVTAGDLRQAVETLEAEAVKPWREALRNLSERHEWQPIAGPCICDAHEDARALLKDGG
jgi:hypothetical protein